MFLRQRARYHRATARPTCICGWCNYVRARASGSMSALERFADSSQTSHQVREVPLSDVSRRRSKSAPRLAEMNDLVEMIEAFEQRPAAA